MAQIEEKVRDVIEREIRPALMADGGDVELVGVEGKTVRVRFLGSCAGCPFRQMTLQNAVEKRIRERVPEVERVEAVE